MWLNQCRRGIILLVIVAVLSTYVNVVVDGFLFKNESAVVEVGEPEHFVKDIVLDVSDDLLQEFTESYVVSTV